MYKYTYIYIYIYISQYIIVYPCISHIYKYIYIHTLFGVSKVRVKIIYGRSNGEHYDGGGFLENSIKPYLY